MLIIPYRRLNDTVRHLGGSRRHVVPPVPATTSAGCGESVTARETRRRLDPIAEVVPLRPVAEAEVVKALEEAG